MASGITISRLNRMYGGVLNSGQSVDIKMGSGRYMALIFCATSGTPTATPALYIGNQWGGCATVQALNDVSVTYSNSAFTLTNGTSGYLDFGVIILGNINA